jgi:glycosyltransferase involved in cell wall biosynthesis
VKPFTDALTARAAVETAMEVNVGLRAPTPLDVALGPRATKVPRAARGALDRSAFVMSGRGHVDVIAWAFTPFKVASRRSRANGIVRLGRGREVPWSDAVAARRTSTRDRDLLYTAEPVATATPSSALRMELSMRPRMPARQTPAGRREPKVLILSLGRNGGCVRYATHVLEHWAGPRYVAVVSAFSNERRPGVPHEAIPTYRSAREFIFRTLFYYPFFILWLVIGLLRGRYSALYLPYSHHWESAPVLLFRLFRKPVVYTVHDGIHHRGEESAMGAAVMGTSIRLATDLVFLTRHVANAACTRYAPRGRVHVVPHGIFRVPGVRRARALTPRPTILFLGRVSPYKGVELLAEAVRGLSRSEFGRLVIAGKSNYSCRIDPFDGLEVRDRWLEESEIVDLLNQAHLLVLPYAEATQSGVVSHGVDACLPMVCTRVGGLVEQLTPEEAVFVDPTPASIRAGIRRVLGDPGLYESLRARLEVKRDTESWEAIAKSIGELFEEPNSGAAPRRAA